MVLKINDVLLFNKVVKIGVLYVILLNINLLFKNKAQENVVILLFVIEDKDFKVFSIDDVLLFDLLHGILYVRLYFSIVFVVSL